MRTVITNEEFTRIMKEHRLWLRNKFRGNRGVFKNIDFAGFNFTNSELVGIVFDNCLFENSIFDGCLIRNTLFIKCDLLNINIKRTSFIDCNLLLTDILFAKITNSNIIHTKVSGGKMKYIDFKNCIILKPIVENQIVDNFSKLHLMECYKDLRINLSFDRKLMDLFTDLCNNDSVETQDEDEFYD